MQVTEWCVIGVRKGAAFCAPIALAVLMGCGHAAKNTLHVTSVTPDAAVDVAGILNGKAYGLSVDRKDVPLYIAYYEPIDVPDAARISRRGLMTGVVRSLCRCPVKGLCAIPSNPHAKRIER